jgi:peptide/nickel transport system substrate-binding protein
VLQYPLVHIAKKDRYMNNRFVSFIIILIIIVVIMTACSSTAQVAAPTATPAPVVTAPPTPSPTPERIGAYLDNIFMFKANEDTAAKQVLDGTLDIYASGLYSNQITVLEDSYIKQTESASRQYEILVNPSKIDNGFNPFQYKEIRQALNILIDRNHIKDAIFNGNAIANSSPIIYDSKDYYKYKNSIDKLNEKYSYDFDTASKTISNTLNKIRNVTQNDENKWLYKNELITIRILIRNDDTNRKSIGEYVSQKLEELGFVVEKKYLSQSESDSLWAGSDPKDGMWHIYTGRRTFNSLPTNMDRVFLEHYTALGSYSHIPLYKTFEVSDNFLNDAKLLSGAKYKDIDERDTLFTGLLETCNDYSYRIWLVDELVKYPYSQKLSLINNTSTRLDDDYATVFTLKKNDTWGGQINWGSSDLLSSPVNPINDARSEKQYINFTELPLIAKNNDTGTTKPLFVKSAQIVFDSSLSYIDDCPWAETSTINKIKVPNDAIVSWDDKNERLVYADKDYLHDNVGLATAWLATFERERPKDRDKIIKQKETVNQLQAIEDRGYLTCNVKYTIEYDKSIFDLKWQDGSSFSVADIVMSL